MEKFQSTIKGSEPMTTISVQLADDVRLFAESYAKQKGFGSVNDLISAWLAEVKDRQMKLESELLTGLDSGRAESKSDEEWRHLRSLVASKGLS